MERYTRACESTLSTDEEEIIDIFLGRTLEGWEMCEKGDSDERIEMNEKSNSIKIEGESGILGLHCLEKSQNASRIWHNI
jgi:hypothetical protein